MQQLFILSWLPSKLLCIFFFSRIKCFLGFISVILEDVWYRTSMVPRSLHNLTLKATPLLIWSFCFWHESNTYSFKCDVVTSWQLFRLGCLIYFWYGPQENMHLPLQSNVSIDGCNILLAVFSSGKRTILAGHFLCWLYTYGWQFFCSFIFL